MEKMPLPTNMMEATGQGVIGLIISIMIMVEIFVGIALVIFVSSFSISLIRSFFIL